MDSSVNFSLNNENVYSQIIQKFRPNIPITDIDNGEETQVKGTETFEQNHLKTLWNLKEEMIINT